MRSCWVTQIRDEAAMWNIVEASGPVCIPLRDEIIESVVISPVAKLDPDIEKLIRQRFGSRMQNLH